MKQSLTGRDAKVVLSKALEHIPALLEFVHAGEDAIEEEVEAEAPAPTRGGGHDEDFDWEGNEDDEEEQVADAGLDGVPRMLQDAKAWDAFARQVYAMRTFERDDLVAPLRQPVRSRADFRFVMSPCASRCAMRACVRASCVAAPLSAARSFACRFPLRAAPLRQSLRYARLLSPLSAR